MEKNLMKFYLIRQAIDQKVIGKVEATQSTLMTEGYDYGAENSVWKIARKDFTHQDFLKTNFEKIKLEPKAIFTDLISSMAINPLFVTIVHRDLLDFLYQFKLAETFSKEVKVVHPVMNIEKEYVAFYQENKYDLIDFGKSEFCVKHINENWSEARPKRFEDEFQLKTFIEEEPWTTSYQATSLKLKEDMDLFRLHKFGGYIVSERLKEAIEDEKFTGISFEPAENLALA